MEVPARTNTQYYKYCDKLEELVDTGKKSKFIQDEIELLPLLIEKYDDQHDSFEDRDPIQPLGKAAFTLRKFLVNYQISRCQ